MNEALSRKLERLKFVYIAGLRNFLAHDYQIDTAADLKKFLRMGIGDIKKFISYI